MNKRGLEGIWTVVIVISIILSVTAIIVAYSNQPQLAPTGEGPSFQRAGNQTHTECINNNTCVVVQGPGQNQCAANSDCQGGNQTLPDLIVQFLTVSIGNQTDNQTDVILFATIKNIGNANAGNSTTRFSVSPFGGQRLAPTSALSPGQSTVVSASYLLSGGNYTAITNADWFDVVTELKEDNNDFTIGFFVL